MRFLVWLVVGAFLAVVSVGGAGAQERRWGVTGLNGDIVATDCFDCGDDLGMIVSCQGFQSNARVEVPFAAAQRLSEGVLPIRLTTDRGQSYTFDGSLVEWGMVGYVPVFELPANHPIIDAIASASTLQVSAGDVEAFVGLGGSRQAMTIFAAHCGWTQMPAFVAETEVQAFDVQADVTGAARWMIEQAVARDGTERLSLQFGVPETDGILLSATCNTGQGTATLDVLVDFGGLGNGEATDLQINTRSGRFTYPGTVFIESSESAGVQVVVGGRAPLWRALQATDTVTFGVPGGAVSDLSAGDQDGVVASFVEGCFTAGASAPAVVAVPKAPLATPAAPIEVTPPKVDSVAPVAVVPAPVEAKPATPAVSAPVAVPAAPAGGTFACGDGSKVVIAISGPESAQVAAVTVGSAAPIDLKGMPPTPSSVFTAGDTALVLKGKSIQLVQAGKLLDCSAP